MHIWKSALIGTAVAVAAIGTIINHKSNPFELGDGNPAAAPGLNSRQPISTTNDLITPKDKHANSNRPDAEYGWGPFRTVDW